MEIDASLAIGIFVAGLTVGTLAGVWVAVSRLDRRAARDVMAQPFGDVPATRSGGIRRTERTARHLRP